MFMKRRKEKKMNKQENDILRIIRNNPMSNQREIAELSGHSLGVVNKAVRNLLNDGYIDPEIKITTKAYDEFKIKAPHNAVILAAGYGMRMVPINTEIPKGLLEVNGEVLIERIIRQLHDVGVVDIYVVVGFMKEKYEYLIDDFGVKLIVNPDYTTKNNLFSLKKALPYLENTYIIPCDIWCEKNPFNRFELYSWYMVSDIVDEDSTVRVNRKQELVSIQPKSGGNAMIGISYMLKADAELLKENISRLSENPLYDDAFWESALYKKDKMFVSAKVVHSSDVVEINTYEQLREMDSDSNHLKTDAIEVICKALNTKSDGITDISVLKKGMTNRSFLFKCNGKKYIMRIPGEGTDKLIDRQNEAMVYSAIKNRNICDNIAYINPDNGFKISEFLEGARVCNPQDASDIQKCMDVLRKFHEMKLSVEHRFDIFGQIEFYESLWNGEKSAYKHYEQTKKNVLSLKKYIDKYVYEETLSHIDAVPDNFLFVEDDNGNENIRLIDWEYAGMQDPHVDLAMFCIYAMYDRQQVDKLIDIYFKNKCSNEIRVKIYCYIAACGLLWSNWCEYKRNLGVDFGEYSLRQYRYAKEYYQVVEEELKKI